MKFKVVALSILLSMPVLSLAMHNHFITMPSAEVLTKRFKKEGLEHFMEETGIAKKLANQEVFPFAVGMAAERALYSFSEDLKGRWDRPQALILAVDMQNRKPHIIKMLLKDHPKELEGLVEEGYFHLLSMPVLSLAMHNHFITMPSAEVLTERFKKEGLEPFVKETSIVEGLANRKILPFDVGMEVEWALYDYREDLKDNWNRSMAGRIAFEMIKHKLHIIKTLLQDHPKELEGLTEEGYFSLK